MDLVQQDFNRVGFFEHACKDAEAIYAKNPRDVENLKKWAGMLMELSQFQSVQSDSIKFVKDAVSKLEEALKINPSKHDIMWTLANAQTSLAFLTEELEDAMPYFAKAMHSFQQALDMDPHNQLYMKSLELARKGPEMHAEFHRQMANQQVVAKDWSTSNTKVTEKRKSSDLKYDILGWVILAIGIVTWVGMAKSHIPPPPPR